MTGEHKFSVEDLTFKWGFGNFSNFSSIPTGRCLTSDAFTAGTDEWCLKFYPNGTDEIESNYFGISLDRLRDGLRPAVAVQGEIAVFSSKHRKVTQLNHVYVTSGAHKIRELAEKFLFIDGNGDVLSEGLTITCTMKVCDVNEIRCPNLTLQLPSDLAELLVEGNLSDITLNAMDKEFKVHQAILSARSPVFHAMFATDMKEKEQNRVEIPDIKPDILDKLLRYIYTEDINGDIAEIASDLLIAANKYQVEGLKIKCMEKLRKELTVENSAEILYLADAHNSPQLKEKALVFIAKYPLAVMETDGWKKFVCSNITLLLDAFKAVAGRVSLRP